MRDRVGHALEQLPANRLAVQVETPAMPHMLGSRLPGARRCDAGFLDLHPLDRRPASPHQWRTSSGVWRCAFAGANQSKLTWFISSKDKSSR